MCLVVLVMTYLIFFLPEVDHFENLGSQIGREEGVEVDVSFRMRETRRAAEE